MTLHIQRRLHLDMIGRGGRVKRYHTEPVLHQQSVGEHTYGVMWFVMMLTDYKPSLALVIATLAHDAAEYAVGDLPAPTKRRANVKEVIEQMESEHLTIVGVPQAGLSFEEATILKLADCLDGLLFCALELTRGNKMLDVVFQNYSTYIKALNPMGVAHEIFHYILGMVHHDKAE